MKYFLKKNAFAVVLVPIYIIFVLWTNNNMNSASVEIVETIEVDPLEEQYFEEMGGKLLLEYEDYCQGGEMNYRGPIPSSTTSFDKFKKEAARNENWSKSKRTCSPVIIKASSQKLDKYVECSLSADNFVDAYFDNNKITDFRSVGVNYPIWIDNAAVKPTCNLYHYKDLEYSIHVLEEMKKLADFCDSKHGKYRELVANSTTKKVRERLACVSKDNLEKNLSIEKPLSFESWKLASGN